MAILADIIRWLRAGYPQGVPDVDYIPLFALLGRHLTDEEVKEIADELAGAANAHSAERLHAAINNGTPEQPRDPDIARFRSRLAAGGWPLAWPGEGTTS